MLIDFAYEPQIKTIQLSPENNPLAPAVTPLGLWNLVLQFDDLETEREYLLCKNYSLQLRLDQVDLAGPGLPVHLQ